VLGGCWVQTEQTELLVGDRYRLESVVGAGGMAVVWRAVDTRLDHHVAVKQVRLPAAGDAEARHLRERASREAQIAGSLRDDPNVVAVRDVIEDKKNIWLVMDFVPSLNMRELLEKRGKLEPGEVAWIGARVADALAAGHEQGICHRDVKPANILINRNGSQVKLSDFGIAYRQLDTQLTQSGFIVGTPAYLAPEVTRGNKATSASDIYSLGFSLYEAIGGRSSLDWNEISADELEPVLRRLLDVDPSLRPDARWVAEQLHGVATGLSQPTSEVLRTFEPDRPTTPSADNGTHGTRVVPPRMRSRLRLLAASGGALLIVALVVVGLIIYGPTSDQPSGTSTSTARDSTPPIPGTGLPDKVGTANITGGDKSVDPCRLMDAKVLRQFGEVEVQRGPGFGACQAIVSPGFGDSYVYLDVEYRFSEGAPSSRKPVTNLGGININWLSEEDAGGTKYCDTAVELSNGLVEIHLQAYTIGSGVDTCTIADTGTAGVARVLASEGVVESDKLKSTPLAGMSACDMFDARAAANAIPNLYNAKQAYFGSWECFFGSAGKGSPSVYYSFQFGDPLDFARTTEVIGGHRFYTAKQVGTYNDSSCQAVLEYRNRSSVDSTQNELVTIHLDGPGSSSELCSQAKTLARAAVKKFQSGT
jgi:eukaryotic-like serine/threonine-protein kinase